MNNHCSLVISSFIVDVKKALNEVEYIHPNDFQYVKKENYERCNDVVTAGVVLLDHQHSYFAILL